MSWMRAPLNLWLRLVERPYLARETDVLKMRASYETKARLFLRAPRSSRFDTDTVGGVPVTWVRCGPVREQAVLLYFHGGAYFMGSANTHRVMLAYLSRQTGLPAILPNYRLGPEHPFPAAFDDAVTVYKGLLDQGFNGAQIVLGGDSAGGGLVLALLAEICRAGLSQPCMTFAFSPLTDFTFSGSSITACARSEVLVPPERIPELSRDYLQSADPRDPRASPLWAPFDGAGPVHLFASEGEILRDDTVRLATRLQAQGVRVHCTLQKGLPHVWPMFHNLLPEARRTLKTLAGHIRLAVSPD